MLSRFQIPKPPTWRQERQVPGAIEPIKKPMNALSSTGVIFHPNEHSIYSPMVCNQTVGKLYDLALIKLSSALMEYKNVTQHQSQQDKVFYVSLTEPIKGNIPDKVKAHVKMITQIMYKSITEWQNHHHRHVFFECSKGKESIYIYNLFNEIVWLPNGGIQPLLTAIKLIESNKLRANLRYRLACLYCLESYESLLWAQLSNAAKKKEKEKCRRFVSYWASKSTNVTNTVSLLRKCQPEILDYHYSAIKFLWYKLPLERRFTEAKIICSSFKNSDCIWFILCNLPDEEFDKVMLEDGVNIIKKLAEQTEFDICIKQIWKRIVTKIDIDSFEDVFKVVVHYRGMDIQKRNDLRWELWNEAPEHLKYLAAKKNPTLYLVSPSNFHLIRDLFHRIAHEDKKSYFNVYCFDFLLQPYWEVAWFHDIVKLVFKDEEEFEKFRRTEMTDPVRIKSTVKLLFDEKWKWTQTSNIVSPFEQLQKILLTCSSDQSDETTISHLKQQFLSDTSTHSILNSIFNFYDPIIVNDFDLFLIGAFRENPQLQDFKKELIRSAKSIDIFKNIFRARLQKLPYVIQLISNFSQSVDDLVKMKSDLMDIALDSINTGKIVEDEFNTERIMWKQLIDWAFDKDADKIQKFKKNIKIDEIFQKCLRKILRTFKFEDDSKDPDPGVLSYAERNRMFADGMKNFTALNSFLEWFFECDSKFREFKSKYVQECDSRFANKMFVANYKAEYPNYQKRLKYILQLWYSIENVCD